LTTESRAGSVTGPQAALDLAMAAAFGDTPPPALGVALSGGGDSVALTLLLHDWARPRGVALHAATVDHGLRPGSRAESEGAGRFCAGLGLSHDILPWAGPDGRGNLMDAARRARQALIADWARARGIGAVALGHTCDDQAETVLMRLARGSGVDGLSGMAAQRQAGGVMWLRPLLAVSRDNLRAVLRARGVGWVDDPSNDDPRFDRVKARRALAVLAPLGLGAAGLVATAARMATARAALGQAAADLCDALVTVDAAGDLLIDAAILDAPEDLRDRIIAQAVMALSGAAYRPRHAALHRMIATLAAGGRATLQGCAAERARDGRLRLGREVHAVAGLTAPPGALWDGRWRLHPPQGTAADGIETRALGAAGLAFCPEWRARGLGRRALMAGPAVWRGASLVAAPLARDDPGWRAELTRGRDELRSALIFH
jgi:tRNA(Ile)-lysidine synthase